MSRRAPVDTATSANAGAPPDTATSANAGAPPDTAASANAGAPPDTAAKPTTGQIRGWLAAVPDPEIPMVSVVELGIVRDVRWAGDGEDAECVVTVTPTYSGCPATEVIARSIEQALRDRGIRRLRVEQRISPPWTTDWITEAGRHKLRASGIAPPAQPASEVSVIDVSRLGGAGGLDRRAPPAPTVGCPHCGSENTRVTSAFGSTPCKALYRCLDCLEPFDYFKSH